MINLCLLVVGREAYKYIAEILTNWENHRTQSEWQDGLIAKEYLFAFINNYFVLIYIAYVEPYYKKDVLVAKGIHSSLDLLEFQLMVVFTMKTFGKGVVNFLKPRIKNAIKVQGLVRRHRRFHDSKSKAAVYCSVKTNLCCYDEPTKKWLAELEADIRNVDDEYALDCEPPRHTHLLSARVSICEYHSRAHMWPCQLLHAVHCCFLMRSAEQVPRVFMLLYDT